MLPGYPGDTTRAEPQGGIILAVHSILAVFFFKGTTPRSLTTGDGVSTYLALTFGTLLSSQGTVASFVLTLSGFPPGFPSVFPTLSDPFGVRFPVGGTVWGFPAFARRPFDIHYVSRFPSGLIIEFREFEFPHAGMTNSTPPREVVVVGGRFRLLANAVAGSSGSGYITHLPGTRQLERRLGTWAR